MPYHVFVTGHRPDKLGDLWEPKLWTPAIPIVKKSLQAIGAKVKDRVLVSCGMAQGFDLICAAAVLQLRQEGAPVGLVAVVPFKGQADQWHNKTAEAWYNKAIDQADEVVMIHDAEPPSRYQAIQWLRERNFWMVDHAREGIACCDMRSASGTMTTVTYAQQKGLEVDNLYSEIKKAMGF